MRLFIAIDLPENVKKHLASLQARLPDKGISKTRGAHLTLQFLGETDEKKIDAIIHALETVHFESSHGSLGEIGFFGRSLPRVIWVEARVEKSVAVLAEDIRKILRPLGLWPDHHFSPHITLGRIKFLDEPEQFKRLCGEFAVEPLTFPVNDFVLYKSTLSTAGPRHEKLKIFHARNFL